MKSPRDHLSIRTFLEEIYKSGNYEDGIRRLCSRFAEREDIQNVGYFYRSLLKRNPESATIAQRPFRGLDTELRAFTLSDEFKKNFGVHVLDEFPDFQRELFIHIPKTGGNSLHLRAAKDPRFVVVRSPLGPIVDIPNWPKYYQGVARQLFERTGFIFLEYHLQVQHVFAFKLMRPQDRIYTIVREPLSLMVSYLNYVLTSVAASVGDPDPPTESRICDALWGLGSTERWRRTLMSSVLLGILDKYLPKNPMCACLGSADADTAYDNVHKMGMQVYDITTLESVFKYYDWESAHENESHKYLEIETIPKKIMYQLCAMSYEDFILYERLKADGIIGNSAAA